MQSVFENDWAEFVAGFDRDDNRDFDIIRWEFLYNHYKCNDMTSQETRDFHQEIGVQLDDIFEYMYKKIGELNITDLTPFFKDYKTIIHQYIIFKADDYFTLDMFEKLRG